MEARQPLDINDVTEIIGEVCTEQDVEISDEFPDDLRRVVGEDIQIGAFYLIPKSLCGKINSAMRKDETLEDKYKVIRRNIGVEVNLRIALSLGFNEYVNKKRKKKFLAPRDELKTFLLKLEDGETWNMQKLIELGHAHVYENIKRIVGTWNERVIGVILGNEVEELLKRNPFTRVENKVVSKSAARGYLVSFLGSISDGEAWNPKKLCAWESDNGVKGQSVLDKIRASYGNTNEATIRNLLGESAAQHLNRNPFTIREHILVSKDDVRKHLLIFLSLLPTGEKWSFTSLYKGEHIGGVKGCSITAGIIRYYGSVNEAAIRNLIGGQAYLYLDKNPFKSKGG